MSMVTSLQFFFAVLGALNASDCVVWCMTLLSLWRSRDERVWNNKVEDAVAIV